MESAKKYFDTAALKTSEVIEISRKYIDVNKEERKLNSLYERFGKAIYNTQKDIRDEEKLAEKLYKEIDIQRNIVIDAKRKLEDSKGVKCRLCGQRNTNKSLFCSRCGEILKK